MLQRGETIRAFLQAPLNHNRFRVFFDLCLATTIGLLKYYRSRGYPVPIERADTEGALSDLAYTLLGEFFQGTSDEPYCLIFDYFARHGVDDFEAPPPEDLYDQFRVLLSGFVKKQLFRRRKTENPQAEILKRRIKDILRPPEYLPFKFNPSDHLMVARADRSNDLRKEAPPLPYSQLANLVQQCYYDANTRTAWCRAVFERLDTEHRYRNLLRLNDVLLAMVRVSATALEETVPGRPNPLAPELGSALEAVGASIHATVAWTGETVVPKFVRKGRLSAADAKTYLEAVELYLLDLGYSGTNDPVPRYFRETMPAEAHAQYLEDYKYTFEAVIRDSTEHFRELLAGEFT